MSKRKLPKGAARKGQSKPFTRATLQQQDERVEFVKNAIASGASRYQIHKLYTEQFGGVWQTAERYMRRARELLLAEAATTKDEERGSAIAFYRAQLLSAKSTIKDKIAARARLDRIFGLDAPTQMKISTPEGGKIQLEAKVKNEFDFNKYEQLCEAFFGVSEANGNGEPVRASRSDRETGSVSGLPGN